MEIKALACSTTTNGQILMLNHEKDIENFLLFITLANEITMYNIPLNEFQIP